MLIQFSFVLVIMLFEITSVYTEAGIQLEMSNGLYFLNKETFLDKGPNYLLLWWQISIKTYVYRDSSSRRCLNGTFPEEIATLRQLLVHFT